MFRTQRHLDSKVANPLPGFAPAVYPQARLTGSEEGDAPPPR